MLRLTPIWLTPAVYFLTNTQAQTMFVQQGTKTDSHITGSAADVHRDCACRHLRHDHNRVVASSVAFAPLRLMGIGHATATGTVATMAACAETRRLQMAAQMGIAWLLLQYVMMDTWRMSW